MEMEWGAEVMVSSPVRAWSEDTPSVDLPAIPPPLPDDTRQEARILHASFPFFPPNTHRYSAVSMRYTPLSSGMSQAMKLVFSLVSVIEPTNAPTTSPIWAQPCFGLGCTKSGVMMAVSVGWGKGGGVDVSFNDVCQAFQTTPPFFGLAGLDVAYKTILHSHRNDPLTDKVRAHRSHSDIE